MTTRSRKGFTGEIFRFSRWTAVGPFHQYSEPPHFFSVRSRANHGGLISVRDQFQPRLPAL